MNESSHVKERPFIQRHPLLTMFIALGVALTLCVIGAVMWFYSDADLDRVRAAAKDMGVELDEDKLRGPKSEQYLLDALTELTQLVEQKNLSFGDSTFHQGLDKSLEYPGLSTEWPLKHGESIPQHLFDFYGKHMNTYVHDEIMKCLEVLRGHKLEMGEHLNIETSLDYIMDVQYVYYHLCEWMLTLPKEEFQRELKSAIEVLGSFPAGSFWECDTKVDILELLIDTAFHRIDDIPIGLGHELDAVCESLQDEVRYAMKMQCVFMMNSFVDLDRNGMLDWNGYSWRRGWLDKMQNRIENRWQRERGLLILLEIAQHAQIDYTYLKAFMLDRSLKERSLYCVYVHTTFSVVQPVENVVCRIRVLRSIISKTPLPNGPFGNPLKEILDTKGRLLGYYNTGADGVDDGWEQESDRGWNNQPIWIYGQLEPAP